MIRPSKIDKEIEDQAIAGALIMKTSFDRWWQKEGRIIFKGFKRETRKVWEAGYRYGRLFQMDYPKMTVANWRKVIALARSSRSGS